MKKILISIIAVASREWPAKLISVLFAFIFWYVVKAELREKNRDPKEVIGAEIKAELEKRFFNISK